MSALESWTEEQRSAYLYRVVARAEHGTPRQGLFDELAERALQQADIWSARLAESGQSVPERYVPDTRARVVAALVRRIGPRRLRPVLAACKLRGLSLYSKPRFGHEMPSDVEKIGQRHKSVGGAGNLRAAVFGVNDGLLSNASLIMGVAGAGTSSQAILLTGAAGLVAGAFSMAAGEYVSVRSQREMYEYQIGLEREELDMYPDEEAAELALIYQARGMSEVEAETLAKRLTADPEVALDALTREELGLNPDELGSPAGAALSSFAAFSTGALVPLLPFLFGTGQRMLYISAGMTAVSLFGVGAALSLFIGRHAWRGGIRMLAIGAAAAAVTFGIGRLLGVGLA